MSINVIIQAIHKFRIRADRLNVRTSLVDRIRNRRLDFGHVVFLAERGIQLWDFIVILRGNRRSDTSGVTYDHPDVFKRSVQKATWV
jgi:hypothetical protein